ncbi:MAG: MinD/ParA family protein [Bradymonadia bacterium]
MRILSVTSGKGGVGKTSLTCNLATRLGQMGQKVLVVDADMGLANVDIVMGIKPKATLEQLFSDEERRLEDILVDGPPNVTVLPAGSGVRDLVHLSEGQVLKFLEAFDTLEETFDFTLIDTGAGIGSNVLYFNAAAQDVLVVATPEPTSMTDAYATMKVLHQTHGLKRFTLLVNAVEDRKEALDVYRRLTGVADKYLDISIDYLGHVLRDNRVGRAIMERGLFIDRYPDSESARCIAEIAERLMEDTEARPPTGNLQFFWRRLLSAGA